MTPGRDTDPGFDDDSPTPPSRRKRDSVSTVFGKAIARGIKKVTPHLWILAVAALSWATKCIDERAGKAQDTANVAKKAGVVGKELAVETKVEAQAGYDATKEKVDATGDVTVELAAEVKALRDEVEKLKLDRSRRWTGSTARKVRTIEIPPEVVNKLPSTPAAAAQQALDAGLEEKK